MQKIVGHPKFINVFKDLQSAVNALHIIIVAREAGKTNKQILELDAFTSLFTENYFKNTSSTQLEWRLKNIARDLKKMSFENLSVEFHEFKKYFDGTKRKVK